jgi:hypothetical protein
MSGLTAGGSFVATSDHNGGTLLSYT